MKIFLLGFIFLSSFSAWSCSCESNSYGQKAAEQAVTTFMKDMRKIEGSDIVSYDTEYIENYLVFGDKFINIIEWIVAVGDTEDAGYQCAMGCEKSANTTYGVRVTYNSGALQCTQDLEVKLEEYTFSKGYSSNVLKTEHPVCL
jgi:hypothetical protein